MTYDLFARRALFDDDHEGFRDSVKEFLDRRVAPLIGKWEEDEDIPREVVSAAGELGLLGLVIPAEYDGGGEPDYRFRAVAIEEFARVGATSLASTISTHADIVVHYIVDLATPEQAERWLPGLATGDLLGAIAMTEPAAGSDLRGIATTAVRDDDGWILNGSKTFISNGIHSNLVIVVARTDRSPDAGSKAFTLFVVEEGTPGFERGRRLKKVGAHAQDTAELSFQDVRIPDSNRLGEVGRGLHALMAHLPLERLTIAVGAVAGARAALAWTIDHVTTRTAFGKTLAEFQNTQFVIAELVTELEIVQSYIDEAIARFGRGELSAVDAAKAKWYASEFHKRTVDRSLQLFGGYGYMTEYPIARAYADVRVTTIYGGATEIMKSLIAREVLGVR